MQIPDELLAKLQEFSAGGFFMLVVNSNGGFDTYEQLDNSLYLAAAHKHLETYLEAHKQIDKDFMAQGIVMEMQEQFEAQMKEERKANRKRKKNGQNPEDGNGTEA